MWTLKVLWAVCWALMFVHFSAGRTPPLLQAPAEKREFWTSRGPCLSSWCVGALQAGRCPGSTYSRSWQDPSFFKGLKTHFPPTLVADSGFRRGYIPFIRGCFPLTAQISKMQMHLEMPPHFPLRAEAEPCPCFALINAPSDVYWCAVWRINFSWGAGGVGGGGVSYCARNTWSDTCGVPV